MVVSSMTTGLHFLAMRLLSLIARCGGIYYSLIFVCVEEPDLRSPLQMMDGSVVDISLIAMWVGVKPGDK